MHSSRPDGPEIRASSKHRPPFPSNPHAPAWPDGGVQNAAYALSWPRSISESSADELGERELGVAVAVGEEWAPKLGFRAGLTTRTIGDRDAAMEMERCFRRRLKRRRFLLTRRILRDLINRRAKLDDESLHNLLHAADQIFFDGKLAGRVRWQWSQPGQERYDNELLGSTALRGADPAGFETLIVLSKPLLQNQQYDRDLLLSAFLHELVHCYLFIRCGVNHAKHDGHTEGFHKIARLISDWIGNDRLRLCHMRANLTLFRNRDIDSTLWVECGKQWCDGHGSRQRPPVQDAQDVRTACEAIEPAEKHSTWIHPVGESRDSIFFFALGA